MEIFAQIQKEIAPWLSLGLQIPVVGLFVYFVLQMQQRNEKTNVARDEAWREFIKTTNDQNNLARKDAMRHGLESIDRISQVVGKLADSIHHHDANADKRVDSILKEIDEVRKELKSEIHLIKEV